MIRKLYFWGIVKFCLFLPGCGSRRAGMTTGVTTGCGHLVKPAIPSLPGLSLLDSGLRRNDDWGGNGIVAIPTAPLLFLTNA